MQLPKIPSKEFHRTIFCRKCWEMRNHTLFFIQGVKTEKGIYYKFFRKCGACGEQYYDIIPQDSFFHLILNDFR